MKHLATTLVGALTLYVISPSGLASTASEELHREVVRFADLDLTRPAGAQQLYRRIERAAHEVCAAYGPGGYDRSCADAAIARAVAEVGAPLLTAHQQALAHRQTLQPRQARLDR
jgi:UrcA family protein